MSPRIMIYVQHLLGVGHLKRMSLIAGELAGRGAEVTLVSGGFPEPQIVFDPRIDLVQLPPLRADGMNFSSLVGEDGAVIDDAGKARRTRLLLDAYETARPDVLVVELFPLGRRQLRFELLPLLDRAKPAGRPIVCSARDILNRRPARRDAESMDWLTAYFDTLLVHGDPSIVTVRDTVNGLDAFAGEIIHTGYVCPPDPPPRPAADSGEILVSAGRGATATHLFEAAAAASRLAGGGLRWRYRHGRAALEQDIARWRAAAVPDAIFEPVAADFPDLLAAARVSVSQFGYNTAVELLQTGQRAVVVPFEGGDETEQAERALAFAQLGFHIVRENALDPGSLAAAVRAALDAPGLDPTRVDMGGLGKTADILMALA